MLIKVTTRSLCALCLSTMVSCGGGSGGGANNPPTNTIDPGNGNGDPASTLQFRDRTSALGLSYSISNDDVSAPEIFRVSGGVSLDDIDNDGTLELYVAHGRNERGRLFTYNGEQFVAL